MDTDDLDINFIKFNGLRACRATLKEKKSKTKRKLYDISDLPPCDSLFF